MHVCVSVGVGGGQMTTLRSPLSSFPHGLQAWTWEVSDFTHWAISMSLKIIKLFGEHKDINIYNLGLSATFLDMIAKNIDDREKPIDK